jgi:hypothetical protein
MNPIVVATFLFINSLVQQRKHETFPSKWEKATEGKASSEGTAPLVEKEPKPTRACNDQ